MARKTKKTEKPIYAVALKVLDRKGLELKALHVTRYCSYADYFVFVTATSSTHAQSIANAVIQDFATSSSKIEGYQKGEWIIVDMGEIIVHIFQKNAREFYNLDKLWSHAPDVSLSKMGIEPEPLARVSAL